MITNAKKLLWLLLLILSVLTLSACGEKDYISMERAKRAESTGPSWTVLVYMCGGDSESREGLASECIKEMTELDYPENINVVVETGGSSQWHINGIYPDYLQRFELQKGGMCLVDQKMADNMGDYRTLEDFLSWGTKTYPAEHYMAVVWDHGGGSLSGISYDELYGDDCLNLEELSYAISLSGTKFDIIGFDAGLSANLETASAIASYGDYMVASAEYAPECWDYTAAIQCLIDYPNGVTGDICRVICDAAYAKCKESKTDGAASLSVTDLSKVSTLAQSFDGLAGVMLTSTDSLNGCAHLQRSLEYAHVYGANSPEEGYSNVIDLGNLAEIVQEDTGTTSDILGQTLIEAVPYKINGKYHDGASGLGVFYPLDNNPDTVIKYMDIDISSNYKQYLRNIVTNTDAYQEEDYHSSNAWQYYSKELQNLQVYTDINEDAYYELNLIGYMGIVKTVGVNRSMYDKKSGKLVSLDFDEKCDSDWDGGIFTYSTSSAPMLNGRAATMRYVGWGGNYKIYTIPVILNGEQTNLRAAYSEASDSYEVIGAWDGVDAATGKADRTLRKIKLFDRITPVLAADDNSYVLGKRFIAGFGGAKLKSKKLKNGSYSLNYRIEDIYGNLIPTESAALDISGTGKDMYK